jgi:hypothetical protein
MQEDLLYFAWNGIDLHCLLFLQLQDLRSADTACVFAAVCKLQMMWQQSASPNMSV